MKHPPARPSATTLPASPHDDASARSRRYLIMMGIRLLCFVLMMFVTPYGWYTAVFGIGAVFLPYVAVIGANVREDVRRDAPENPERAIEATPSDPPPAPGPTVIRIQETPRLDAAKDPDG